MKRRRRLSSSVQDDGASVTPRLSQTGDEVEEGELGLPEWRRRLPAGGLRPGFGGHGGFEAFQQIPAGHNRPRAP